MVFSCREKDMSHVIRLPDFEVSKVCNTHLWLVLSKHLIAESIIVLLIHSHFSRFFQLQCNIEFDKERRQYFICDVGSRNGTFLNGSRLSEVHCNHQNYKHQPTLVQTDYCESNSVLILEDLKLINRQ